MTPDEIRSKVASLDARDWRVDEAVWPQLEPLGVQIVPYLRDAYPTFRRGLGRQALVHHSIKFARESEDAFQLGLTALDDRSIVVIYSACMLLAYSLRDDAIEPLENVLDHKDKRAVDDARAAIDSIKHRNHHYFKDRCHSGRVFLVINPSDNPSYSVTSSSAFASPKWKAMLARFKTLLR